MADLGGEGFDIPNFQNITTSGVHAPPYEVHPLRKILDPPLRMIHYHRRRGGGGSAQSLQRELFYTFLETFFGQFFIQLLTKTSCFVCSINLNSLPHLVGTLQLEEGKHTANRKTLFSNVKIVFRMSQWNVLIYCHFLSCWHNKTHLCFGVFGLS